jgi:RimJ/RimL family protein N-acetyltransferase
MTLNFNPKAEYILEDERVLLRPLKEPDLELLFPFAINEPDTWKYSTISLKGQEGMKNYINAAINGRADGKEYPFIIFDKKSNKYAGSTRFYDIQPCNHT